MKKLFEEFNKFINRGNVLDLAVGVVVGGAFTSIVNSIVNDLIMPFVGLFVGGLNFDKYTIPLKGDAEIKIGNFIESVVSFLIIAFVVFIVVKAVNRSKEKFIKHHEEKPTQPAESDEVKLLKSIDKELKKLNKTAK